MEEQKNPYQDEAKSPAIDIERSSLKTALPDSVVPLAGQLVQHVGVVVEQDVQNVLTVDIQN